MLNEKNRLIKMGATNRFLTTTKISHKVQLNKTTFDL